MSDVILVCSKDGNIFIEETTLNLSLMELKLQNWSQYSHLTTQIYSLQLIFLISFLHHRKNSCKSYSFTRFIVYVY